MFPVFSLGCFKAVKRTDDTNSDYPKNLEIANVEITNVFPSIAQHVKHRNIEDEQRTSCCEKLQLRRPATSKMGDFPSDRFKCSKEAFLGCSQEAPRMPFRSLQKAFKDLQQGLGKFLKRPLKGSFMY